MKKIIHSLRLLAIGAMLFFVVACASKLTSENLAKVKNGMTEDEVKAILGKPTAVETSGMLGISGSSYTYKTKDSEVKVIFLNGKVMTTQGSFQ
jgi:hypothetical protein